MVRSATACRILQAVTLNAVWVDVSVCSVLQTCYVSVCSNGRQAKPVLKPAVWHFAKSWRRRTSRSLIISLPCYDPRFYLLFPIISDCSHLPIKPSLWWSAGGTKWQIVAPAFGKTVSAIRTATILILCTHPIVSGFHHSILCWKYPRKDTF